MHTATDSSRGPSDPSAVWPAVAVAVTRRSPAGGGDRAARVAVPLGGGPQPSSEAANSCESTDTADARLSADTGAGAGGGGGLSKGDSPGLSADSGEGSTQPGSSGLSFGESAESAADAAGLSADSGGSSATPWAPRTAAGTDLIATGSFRS